MTVVSLSSCPFPLLSAQLRQLWTGDGDGESLACCLCASGALMRMPFPLRKRPVYATSAGRARWCRECAVTYSRVKPWNCSVAAPGRSSASYGWGNRARRVKVRLAWKVCPRKLAFGTIPSAVRQSPGEKARRYLPSRHSQRGFVLANQFSVPGSQFSRATPRPCCRR